MFTLPNLPYAPDALEPTVSRTTMETHWGKHHRTYVDKTNELTDKAGLQDQALEDVVRQAAAGKESNPKLFNNAGQAWNHGFFWQSMTPDRTQPTGAFASAIDEAFGGLADLKARFVDEGVNHFASGWAWVMYRGGQLEVISTHDADTALLRDGTPLLVCDLWEHAYYLDYKQDRKGFLETWFDSVANWRFAASQYEVATSGGKGWRYPS